jgi:Tfp pilus assembly protein PilF
MPEALYNAGLAQQRCGSDADARKYFQQTLALDPRSHRARSQLALYSYKEGGDAALESTIASLQQAVLDAEFQNTEALVNLAMLQMKRNGPTAGTGCASDLDCARKNIQRALAVDDSYMPAFNQLAIYYLERAREKSGQKRRSTAALGRRGERALDQQQLELAALVCSQATRKNPGYAAIHNTAGLIQVELGNVNAAVQAFGTAARLDPRFFEAQMNLAAVNLSFRGFKQAEEAYRAAIKMRPNDYDAHLGLALALRGQIASADPNGDAQVKGVQEVLDRARTIDPARPETFYNEGILTQEFKVKLVSDPRAQAAVLDQAAASFTQFLARAGAAADYQDGVRRARERLHDIAEMRGFIGGGLRAEPELPPAIEQPAGLGGEPAAGPTP